MSSPTKLSCGSSCGLRFRWGFLLAPHVLRLRLYRRSQEPNCRPSMVVFIQVFRLYVARHWRSGNLMPGFTGQMPKTRSLHQSYQCLVLLPYRRFLWGFLVHRLKSWYPSNRVQRATATRMNSEVE